MNATAPRSAPSLCAHGPLAAPDRTRSDAPGCGAERSTGRCGDAVPAASARVRDQPCDAVPAGSVRSWNGQRDAVSARSARAQDRQREAANLEGGGGHAVDDEIRRKCAVPTWKRVRRNVCVTAESRAALSPVARHRLLAAAALPAMAADTVLSHQSAAVVYGAPVWSVSLDRLHVTRNRRHGGRIKPHVTVHCAPLESAAEVDGMLLTTPARTIVDLGLTLPFGTAVVAGDRLVREFGITAADLASELEFARYRRGIQAARRVVDFLNPHSRSTGESISRIMLRGLDLPMPAPDGEVFTRDGRFLGRVAFYFGDSGVVGEFEGSAIAESPVDAALSQRIRWNRLRDNGFQVVTWTSSELAANTVAVRLLAALADTHRPSGYIRQAALPDPRPLHIRRLHVQPANDHT